MKTKSICCAMFVTLWASHFPLQAGQLTTDELNVFGEASFFGDVNIGWNMEATSLTNGLVLYYDFNTNGAVVADQSGNNYTGTVTGATWTNGSFLGGGYYFDGNDYISAGDVLDLTGSFTNMTISVWVKLPSLPSSEMHIVSKSQTASPYTGWELIKITQHQPFSRIIADYNAGQRVEAYGSQALEVGIWHHLVATYRAENNVLKVSTYLDGVLQASAQRSGSYVSLNNATALTIGARQAGASQFYTGHMDEVRIYNRVMDDQEVGGMYAWYIGSVGSLNVKDLIVDNKLTQTGTGTNILMGPTGIGVTNPVGQLQVGGMLNVDGNIRLNDNWLSGDGDDEGVSVSSDGTVTILKLEPQGDISLGTYTNQP